MKLTDEQIIKAVEEYLQKSQNIKSGARQKILVDADFLKNALDLINRKDAEIERLQIRNKTLSAITRNYDWKFAKVKSEAIKEIAERLKKESSSCVTSANGYEIYETKSYTIMATTIDNLVKEMVGE